MTEIPDPRVHARHYFKKPPAFALAVDEPWWWPVLALGSDIINVHFQCGYRGPLAIVSREQKPWHRSRDVQAIEAILRAEKRPAFDAYSCPKAPGMIVGLVDVVDCVDDPKEQTSWFVGPYALIVEKPCLLPIGRSGAMQQAQGLMAVDPAKRDAILYGLTSMANGHFQPGAEKRR
jgi:hypothetical protein